MIPQETIVALATPSGAGAIAVIRLSGKEAINIAALVFESVSGKDITKQKTDFDIQFDYKIIAGRGFIKISY